MYHSLIQSPTQSNPIVPMGCFQKLLCNILNNLVLCMDFYTVIITRALLFLQLDDVFI